MTGIDPPDPDTDLDPGSSPVELCRYYQRAIRPAMRVMFCGRCGHATGGGYGHYSRWCTQADAMREHHFCCPGSCSLVDGEEMDPTASCHPSSGGYDDWARDEDARYARVRARRRAAAGGRTEGSGR